MCSNEIFRIIFIIYKDRMMRLFFSIAILSMLCAAYFAQEITVKNAQEVGEYGAAEDVVKKIKQEKINLTFMKICATIEDWAILEGLHAGKQISDAREDWAAKNQECISGGFKP